jgi:hypothetical protein
MSKDFIPGKDSAYTVFFENLERYVDMKTYGPNPAWTHIPEADRTALTDTLNGWKNAYTPTLPPHSPQTTREKNRVRKSSEKFLRIFINRFLRYPPVTDADRDAMAIPNRKPGSSPIPPPKVQVEADLTFPGIHVVELRKIRPVTGVEPDPDPRSDYGVRIYYSLTGDPTEDYQFRLTGAPKSGKKLPYSVFTRRRKRFDFDGESGNTVYFCLRYENPSGEAGEFGPILSAVIP